MIKLNSSTNYINELKKIKKLCKYLQCDLEIHPILWLAPPFEGHC